MITYKHSVPATEYDNLRIGAAQVRATWALA